MSENFNQIVDAAVFAIIGIIIGIGQSLRDKEHDVLVVIGRAVCTGGLAAAAGTVLIWWPDLPFLGQIGVAAALASLGTSILEKLAMRYFQKGTPE